MTRDDLLSVFHSAVAAVDPEVATSAAIRVSGADVSVGETTFEGVTGTPVVIALGKGACAMARGVATSMGPVRGVAVSDHIEQSPVEVIVGGHPIPNEQSVAAGERLLEAVQALGADDLVVFCISGGGSALAEVPVTSVGIGDVAELNRTLIASGLPIEVINDVRTSVSRIKGGRLAVACAAERLVTIVLSDVVGAGPEAVASGPSLGFGLGSVPDDVIAMLVAGGGPSRAVVSAMRTSQPVRQEREHPFVVIGSPVTSAAGAVGAFAERGIGARVWTSSLTGDVETAVDELIDQLRRTVRSDEAVVATGEVTVRISGGDRGGRNQHAALVAAKRIAGTDIVFGAFGTDGRDGPTDAAGAVVDGASVARMASKGVDIDESLRSFASYDALLASGDLVVTGPTGTNVADLWMIGRQT